MAVLIETVKGDSYRNEEFNTPEHLVRAVIESKTSPTGRVWIGTEDGSWVNLDHVVAVHQA